MLSYIIRQVSIPLYWLDNFKYFLKDSVTIDGDEATLLIENKYLGKLKDIISKFNEKFPWNGDTKEIADTAIARQLLDM